MVVLIAIQKSWISCVSLWDKMLPSMFLIFWKRVCLGMRFVVSWKRRARSCWRNLVSILVHLYIWKTRIIKSINTLKSVGDSDQPCRPPVVNPKLSSGVWTTTVVVCEYSDSISSIIFVVYVGISLWQNVTYLIYTLYYVYPICCVSPGPKVLLLFH